MQALLEKMSAFSEAIGRKPELSLHVNNKFNRQYSLLIRDWNYLKIILNRIETTDPHEAATLGLDLKSLYVFGRVYSESLIYIASFLVKSTKEINWKKIGPFIESIKKHLSEQPEEFKLFWLANEKPITNLYNTFKYRNDILHEKDSNTEWTFVDPRRSNLESVRIENVAWREDKGIFKEKKTLNAKDIIGVLSPESIKILDHLISCV